MAAAIGLGMLAVFVVCAVFAPIVAPYRTGTRFTPYGHPGWRHLLGTDDVGHDLFTHLVFGARASLEIAVGVAVASTAVGIAVAAVAGLSDGLVGGALMRLADVVLAVPFLPLVLVAAAFLGAGIGWEIALLSAVMWARPARILRAEILSARRRGHTEAAAAMGAGRARLLVPHVSYYVAPLVIPLFIRAAMVAVLLDASLAFLGVGNPGVISWGTLLYWANVRDAVLTDAWLWWVLPPGLAIAGLVVGCGLVGLSIEERLNAGLEQAVGIAAVD